MTRALDHAGARRRPPWSLRLLAGLLGLLSLGLGACAALPETPRLEYYVIKDQKALAPVSIRASTPVSASAPVSGSAPARLAVAAAVPMPARPAPGPATPAKVLLLGLGQSQSLYDSERMTYSPDGRSRAYFQFASWGERPARRLMTLVEERLSASGRFAGVALTTAGVRGDWILSVRLDELYVDEAAQPPLVHLSVNAELVDWQARRLIGRQRFVERVALPGAEARHLAAGANTAVTQWLDELEGWLAEAEAAALADTAGRSGR